MSSEHQPAREPSLLDASCDNFLADLAQLTPTDATEWGIEGYEGELQDFSPEYFAAVADRTREMVADLDALDDSTDESDDEDDFDDVDTSPQKSCVIACAWNWTCTTTVRTFAASIILRLQCRPSAIRCC